MSEQNLKIDTLLFAKIYHRHPEHREELIERSGIIADGCEIEYSESDYRAAELIRGKYGLLQK